MRAALIVVAIVVLITGGLTWWLMRDPTLPTPGPTTGSTNVAPDDGPRPFVHLDGEEGELEDAGVGLVEGKVVTEEGAPVAGAKVQLTSGQTDLETLSCAVCEQSIIQCDHPTTVRQVIDGIRAHRFPVPTVIAEMTTGPDGTFRFEDVSLNGMVVATFGKQSGSSYADEGLEITLGEELTRELYVMDPKQQGLPGVKVEVYEPRTGRLSDVTTDAEGRVSITSTDQAAYVFIDRPGDLPVGRALENLSQFTLSGPRTLVVHTMMGGKPVEADVTLALHRQPRTMRTKDGVLRIEQLPIDVYSITVAAEGLAAAMQSVETNDEVTEVTFELRRGAKLLVSVISADGNPLESVNGSLQGNDGDASADAENGALLILGPVPEGEYMLNVYSRGMVHVNRLMDLTPGETSLEVVLRGAPTLKGTVLLPDGSMADDVRVTALEGDVETEVDFVRDDGLFDMEFQYPGQYRIRAQSNRDGDGEVMATVPGPPVTITLNAKGVIEAELTDFDGKVLPANFTVRSTSPKARNITWMAADEEKPLGRAAGLDTGTYVLERELEGRIPIKKEVQVVSGKVTHVQIKADRGGSVTGRVVDADGKPVARAMILVTDRSEPAFAEDNGSFERHGLMVGEVEIWASRDDGAETAKVKVKTGARDVQLKFPPMTYVSGRVVDEKGTPIREFDANEQHVIAADGKFRVPAPAKTLDVWVEGYSAAYHSEASGDVGDVVLRKTPLLEGDVVDPEGKPVGGATVMGTLDLGGVVTDANGRFKLNITSEDPQELVATRGAWSGRAPLKLGAPAHLVLQKGTKIVGRVIDAAGKGIPSVVMASSQTVMRPMELETDEQGHFEADLARGVWLFSSRSFRTSRAIEVKGERMEITIGDDPAACSAIVRAQKPIDSLWFLPRDMERSEGPWEVVARVPGSLEVPIGMPALEINARGIPCGRYEIAASIESMVTSTKVDLRQAGQVVELPLPLTVPDEVDDAGVAEQPVP